MKRTITLFAAILAACSPAPEDIARQAEDRKTAVMEYASGLQLTPVAYLCVGREHNGLMRQRCDLRTREAGVLPLVCNSACRLID